MVAQERGTKFNLLSCSNALGPSIADNSVYRALTDVATWLDYPDFKTYNKTCRQDPDEVRRRLREAQ